MKAIMKIFPAALAMLALASCSTDVFDDEKTLEIGKNSIGVYLDNGSDNTRAGIKEGESGNKFVWTAGDLFKLYGKTERATEQWKITATADASASYSKADLAALAVAERTGAEVNFANGLAYAIYPDRADKKNYFNSEFFEEFYIQMDGEWDYNDELAADGVYYAQFPMWGEADTEGQRVTFKYTTAFLRLDLSGLSAASKAQVIVTADKQLNGRFKGNVTDADGYPSLVADDEEIFTIGNKTLETAATLESEEATDPTHKTTVRGATSAFDKQQITINLSGLTNNASRIIYLPLPAQNYGYLSVVLYYPNEARTDVLLKGRTLNAGRGKFYKITKALSVTDEFKVPSDINQELYDNKEKTERLNYVSHVQMTVSGTDQNNVVDGKNLNTILVPKMATPEITLNFDYPTVPSIDAAAASTLYINDLDGSDPFTGKLIINTATISNNITIQVNLKGASEIVFLGGTSANPYQDIEGYNVKNLTLGDGKTATFQNTTKEIQILAGTSATLRNTGSVVNVLKAAKAGVVRMRNLDADVNVEGSVNYIKLYRNNPDVVVKGEGVVDHLDSEFTPASGKMATGTVKSYDAANIKAANAGAQKNLAFTSQWDGVSVIEPTNDIFTAAQFAFYNKDNAAADLNITLSTDIDLAPATYDGLNTFTANTWEGIRTTGSVTIQAEADNYGTAANYLTGTSKYHKISNLNLSGALNDDYSTTGNVVKAGVGLIASAAAVKVSNLTLDNVTCALNHYQAKSDGTGDFDITKIGALAGAATGDVSLEDVNVTLAGEKFGYTVDNGATSIGGLIGEAAAEVTIDGCSVNAASTSIYGYYNLGGMIGLVSTDGANVAINKTNGDANCAVTLGGFTVTYANGKDIDKQYGKVGGYIGSLGTQEAVGVYWNSKFIGKVTIADGQAATVTTWPTMTKNKIIQGTAPNFNYLSYTRNNNFIGYFGDTAPSTGTITIAGGNKKSSLTEPAENKPNYLYWFQ